MRDYNEYTQIDRLDEEYDDFYDDEFSLEQDNDSVHISVPFLQIIACVLILAALVFFKFTDEIKYEEITDWYKENISREIELPEKADSTQQEESEVSVSSNINSEVDTDHESQVDETKVERV